MHQLKRRTCAHCGEPIPLNFGFHFDENLNMIHTKCGKIIFSTQTAKDNSTTSYYQTTTPYNPSTAPKQQLGGYKNHWQKADKLGAKNDFEKLQLHD
ncbi:MAG: hypothetical protein DWQ19_09730 [Crenarchaeota archaeon]|nr:MAG: hypothetical protein DWQ19_09730 [Thermoproteota archaeon]